MRSLKLCILYPTQYENLFVIVMLRYLYFYKRLAIKKKKSTIGVTNSSTLHCKIANEKMPHLFTSLRRHRYQNPLNLTQSQSHWPLQTAMQNSNLLFIPRGPLALSNSLPTAQKSCVGQRPGSMSSQLYQ